MKKLYKTGIRAGLSLLLAALLCSAVLVSAAELAFSDVPADAWYCEDVTTAVREGLVNGRSETEFAPEEYLTAAEAVKLAACMNQARTAGAVTLENGDPWYATYAAYAKENGIIDGDLDWDVPVTRAQYMAIFARALPEGNYVEVNAIPDGGLSDVKPDTPYTEGIYKLARAGIVQGDENHNINPEDPIKRKEVAAILTRMMHPEKRVSFWRVPEPAVTARDFVGTWNDLTSKRATMTIMSSAEYPYYDVVIHWADSASSAAEWTMKASFDEENGWLVYESGRMAVVTYDENGTVAGDGKWDDGKGFFKFVDGGLIHWEDTREDRSTQFSFERAELPAPTAEELQDGFFRVIGGIETGTAGASLKKAEAIAEVMGFASRSTIWACDNAALRSNILAAWNGLTAEEQAAFDGNFISVLTDARDALNDWETVKGVYEDAGVADTVAGYLAHRGSWLSWETLTSNTLTMGNSDGPAEAEAAPTGDAFVGEWQADRAGITITPSEDGYLCRVYWSSSASERSEWEYFCWFDGEYLASVETGTRRDLVYGSDGQVISSTLVFSDGAAAFRFNEDGKLTWTDFKTDENNLEFERLPSPEQN